MTHSRDSIADIWGARTPYQKDWPVRVDEQTSETPERWVPSACVLCSNECALDIGVKAGKIVGVRGRADDRVNRGRYAGSRREDRTTQLFPPIQAPERIRELAQWAPIGLSLLFIAAWAILFAGLLLKSFE